MAAAREPDDHVFRYPLRARPSEGGPGAPLELLRQQLQQVLDVVTPTQGGREVKVDGFKTLADDSHVHPIFRPGHQRSPSPGPNWPLQNRRNASLYEPRIEFIARQLESLLSLVELEVDGRPVTPDSFRLHDLSQWTVPSACDPVEVFGYAGGHCNVDCVFCYNRGNPPDLALGSMRRPAGQTAAEMATRLRHFDPAAGRALFPSLGDVYEVLAHPAILPALRELRGKTDAVFRLSTTGRLITPEFAEELARLQPVFVYLSLHSAWTVRLQELIRTPVPQTHLDAPRVLREHGIPYALVVVPWPKDGTGRMLDDLRALVELTDGEFPYHIEVHLPGYTRFFSEEPLFDRQEVWSAIVGTVRQLRLRTRSPIVVMPGIYEETAAEGPRNLPLIAGTVANSPAERAGLGAGDMLTAVGAVAVTSRPQARDVLSALGSAQPVRLAVRRAGRAHTFTVVPQDFTYPYDPRWARHLGVVFAGGAGFRSQPLWQLRTIIEAHNAKRVVFFSSLLVRPYMEEALRTLRPLAGLDVQLDIRVPENGYLGGNVILGDLLVVQDFIDAIEQYVQETGRPDLAVIPSTPFRLGAWKRDLTGRPYLDIERETGVPVALLECESIYD